jgi:hypothetical protein
MNNLSYFCFWVHELYRMYAQGSFRLRQHGIFTPCRSFFALRVEK